MCLGNDSGLLVKKQQYEYYHNNKPTVKSFSESILTVTPRHKLTNDKCMSSCLSLWGSGKSKHILKIFNFLYCQRTYISKKILNDCLLWIFFVVNCPIGCEECSSADVCDTCLNGYVKNVATNQCDRKWLFYLLTRIHYMDIKYHYQKYIFYQNLLRIFF